MSHWAPLSTIGTVMVDSGGCSLGVVKDFSPPITAMDKHALPTGTHRSPISDNAMLFNGKAVELLSRFQIPPRGDVLSGHPPIFHES